MVLNALGAAWEFQNMVWIDVGRSEARLTFPILLITRIEWTPHSSILFHTVTATDVLNAKRNTQTVVEILDVEGISTCWRLAAGWLASWLADSAINSMI